MKIYLGLGSNLGDRRAFLERALQRLKELLQPNSMRISPLYETPALLPPGAEGTWNLPFFNIVAELESSISPQALLQTTQAVELELGRTRISRWSPREIDIDILLYGDLVLQLEELVIPHPEIKQRAFVLDPLKDLAPQLCIPGENKTVLDLARKHPQHSPLWMAVLNTTPDSFSDGGIFSDIKIAEKEMQVFLEQNLGIIDIGGESTRPGAETISPEEEWKRIEPSLRFLREQGHEKNLKPWVSVDTRHHETAALAIEYGVDIINDVSGLADPRFVELLKNSSCDYVLMHSLSIPADSSRIISSDKDVVEELLAWFSGKIEYLVSQGIDKNRILLDPGIGFGKTALQSQIILQNIEKLFDFGLRVLVGHSRKSFLKIFSSAQAAERDPESIGVSLAMVEKGVDILRVHNPEAHIRVFQGWSHVRSSKAL